MREAARARERGSPVGGRRRRVRRARVSARTPGSGSRSGPCTSSGARPTSRLQSRARRCPCSSPSRRGSWRRARSRRRSWHAAADRCGSRRANSKRLRRGRRAPSRGANAGPLLRRARRASEQPRCVIIGHPLPVVILRLLMRERLPTSVLLGVGVASRAWPCSPTPRAARARTGSSSASSRRSCGRSARSPRGCFRFRWTPFTATAWEMIAGGLLLVPRLAANETLQFAPSSSTSILAWIYLVTIGLARSSAARPTPGCWRTRPLQRSPPTPT